MISFAGLEMELPPGWGDITEAEAPPTLAKDDGVGALQVSVAIYAAGEAPKVDFAELESMILEFGEKHRLGARSDLWRDDGEVAIVSCDFVSASDYTRVWYLSNGADVCLVTYAARVADVRTPEIGEADRIVKSIRFPRQVSPN